MYVSFVFDKIATGIKTPYTKLIKIRIKLLSTCKWLFHYLFGYFSNFILFNVCDIGYQMKLINYLNTEYINRLHLAALYERLVVLNDFKQ